MALSNIFKEPQREITETGMGMMLIVPLIGADVVFAKWLETIPDPNGDHCPFFAGMVFGVLGFAVLVGVIMLFFLLVHQLGEAVCDRLQRRGIHLRPRRRSR